MEEEQKRSTPLVVVGLGNPGARYRDTRHNVGFDCIDRLAERWNIPIKDRRKTTALGQGYHEGKSVVLAKPRTFMNLSGESVGYLLARFGGRPGDLMIVYDEMALPLGRIRLRARGSDAGHNGIKDIIRTVHTVDFPRLRIGIGGPGMSGSVDHVLGRFSDDERPDVNAAVARAAEAVECLLMEGINIAMNRYNTDPQAEPPANAPGDGASNEQGNGPGNAPGRPSDGARTHRRTDAPGGPGTDPRTDAAASPQTDPPA